MNNYSLRRVFKCPLCKGRMFGTSDCLGDYPKGHCHDFNEDGTSCQFTWDRKTEDKDVFVDE